MGTCQSTISECFGSSSTLPQRNSSLNQIKHHGKVGMKTLAQQRQQGKEEQKAGQLARSKNSINPEGRKSSGFGKDHGGSNSHSEQQPTEIDDSMDNDAQARAMKKVDSTRYLLKHSNLSCIIEEEEHVNDSAHLHHQNSAESNSENTANTAKRKDNKNGDASMNNAGVIKGASSLTYIEDIASTPKGNNNNKNNKEETEEDNQENYRNQLLAKLEQYSEEKARGTVNSFCSNKISPDKNLPLDLPTVLSNYQTIGLQAERDFADAIRKDYIPDGFTLEHTDVHKDPTTQDLFYSKIYAKPAQTDKYKYFKIRTEFNLYGVSAREYMHLTLNEEHSKENNSSIDSLVELSACDDHHLIYISYKKVLVISARDFVYLKRNKQIDATTYLTVQTSVNLKEYPVQQGKERAEIILSGSLISEDTDEQGRPFISLINYTESNLKMSLNHKIIKLPTIKELKKYILNLQAVFSKGQHKK